MVDDLSIMEISVEIRMKGISLEEESEVKVTAQVENEQVKKTIHHCNQCEYSTLNESQLADHIQSKHVELERTTKSNDAETLSQITGTSAEERSSLDSIQELNCRDCEFESEDPVAMKNHKEVQHNARNIEKILQCGAITQSHEKREQG